MADITSFPIPTVDADYHIDGRVSATLGGDPATGKGALLARGAILYVESMVDLLALPTESLADGQAVNLLSYHAPIYPSAQFYGGGVVVWDSTRPKSNHDGGAVISPTVPWDGTQASHPDFLNRVGETTPGGTGCFVHQQQDEVWAEIYGAKGDWTGTSGTDNWPAINAAANRNLRGTGTTIFAGRVKFRDAGYYMSQTLNLKRIVHLQGMYANTEVSAGPRLIFVADASGIIVNRHNTIDDTVESTPSGRADGSKIEGLSLVSLGGTDTSANGLWLRARADVSNGRILSFPGNGLQVIASAGGATNLEGNANNFAVSAMRISNCGNNGVYTNGADANAGALIGVDASANGQWGFYDSSFLGNTYVACHTSSNSGGSYKADNGNARNIYLGCYTEGGQPASDIIAPSTVIGGLFGDKVGSGFILSSTTTRGQLSSFFVNQPSTASRDFTTTISRLGDESITWQASGDHSSGLSFTWSEAAGNWLFNHAGLSTRNALGITTDANTLAFGRASAVPAGWAYMPNGLLIGNSTDGRHITYDTAPPSTGEHARGDIVYNTDPVAGGFVGWSCVTGGSPGTWKTFGAISE